MRGAKPKHGHARAGNQTSTYISWMKMRSRCNQPSNRKFPRYGGRGISVCRRWDSFSCFLDDMGERPSGKTLGRIDNDGNYEPGNCQWETPTQQARTSAWARMVTALGKTQNISAWSECTGIPEATLRYRLDSGMSPDMAMLVPIRRHAKYRKRRTA